MTEREKQLVWRYREFCKVYAKALPKFLAAVPKTDKNAVQESYRLLEGWAPVKPLDALELLDSKFADQKVREYAVKRLEELADEELLDYLLQLVQALKYEPYHDSALARFCLRRALRNSFIGHHLFWYLKSEVHVEAFAERFGQLLEAYLRGCGKYRLELKKQDEVQKRLLMTANSMKVINKNERIASLHEQLRKLPWPDKLQLILNPSIEVQGVNIELCKTMDSKKVPLWLVYNNRDKHGSPPYVIFKSGDDLRQDMLTLQIIRIMDKLWKKENLDLHLIPYGCIATGNEIGMIEIVRDSATTGSIAREAGGARQVFNKEKLAQWVRKNNPSDEQYNAAVDRFVTSCAGYCVATYVLGIGDRHNDNVMVTKDGRLFHIDFGHFLGNFKKKFGIKRENAPFILTPDFAYVMGGRKGEDFQKFTTICCRAYNIVRKHASTFINLFAMMLLTGIPELTKAEDIKYLQKALALGKNDTAAAEYFKNLISKALGSSRTLWNNYLHLLARG